MVARSSSLLQKTMADKKANTLKATASPTDSEAGAMQDSPGYQKRVFDLVRQIPAGRVMTYGQIADLLGEGYTPRTVGFVMHAADEETVPWQRVINSQGACSTGRVILPPDKQQRMLEAEGIRFDARGRCSLAQYRWSPGEDETGERQRDETQPSLFSD